MLFAHFFVFYGVKACLRRTRVKNLQVFSQKDLTKPFLSCIIFVVHRGIAQLVEYWSPKPWVVGSSPSAPAKKKAIRDSGWLFSVKFVPYGTSEIR